MSDILGKFAKNTTEGAASAAPASSHSQTSSGQGDLNRGENLINKTGASPAASSTAAEGMQQNTDVKATDSSASESTGTNVVNNPDEWTKESALKEVKKLREEAKAVRTKYQEQVEKIKVEQDARNAAQSLELQKLQEAQKELDRIKAEQEDKKRDLSEKVAHREAKLTELQTIFQARENEYQKKISDLESVAKQYQAEKDAETEVYRSRVSEEINKIPEKFRDYANLIVKGSGDPRDALLALNEAKLKGMFEDKTVIINHSVPGAKDGARSSKERLEEADKAKRESMSSNDKIRTALSQMKSGQANNAFRMK